MICFVHPNQLSDVNDATMHDQSRHKHQRYTTKFDRDKNDVRPDWRDQEQGYKSGLALTVTKSEKRLKLERVNAC